MYRLHCCHYNNIVYIMIIPVLCYALAISTVSMYFMPIKHFEFEFKSVIQTQPCHHNHDPSDEVALHHQTRKTPLELKFTEETHFPFNWEGMRRRR